MNAIVDGRDLGGRLVLGGGIVSATGLLVGGEIIGFCSRRGIFAYRLLIAGFDSIGLDRLDRANPADLIVGYIGFDRLGLIDALDRGLMHLLGSRLSLDRILTLDRTHTTDIGGSLAVLIAQRPLGYRQLPRRSRLPAAALRRRHRLRLIALSRLGGLLISDSVGLDRLGVIDTRDRRLVHLFGSRLSLDRVLTLDGANTTDVVRRLDCLTVVETLEGSLMCLLGGDFGLDRIVPLDGTVTRLVGILTRNGEFVGLSDLLSRGLLDIDSQRLRFEHRLAHRLLIAGDSLSLDRLSVIDTPDYLAAVETCESSFMSLFGGDFGLDRIVTLDGTVPNLVGMLACNREFVSLSDLLSRGLLDVHGQRVRLQRGLGTRFIVRSSSRPATFAAATTPLVAAAVPATALTSSSTSDSSSSVFPRSVAGSSRPRGAAMM